MAVNKAELETICRIAEAAGREIMDVYCHGGETWQKDDASPLTEADLRADKVIRQALEREFPGVFILSEESSSAGMRKDQRFFLVDPLDGTKEFLKRNDEFTVNIALVEHGRPVAGVVFAPAMNELFYAADGVGAWKHDQSGVSVIGTAVYDASRPLRVMGSRSHGGDELNVWLARLDCAYTFVAGGSSLKFCRIAEGAADVYPRFGLTSQWDTAAAQAVLEIAGGEVKNLKGESLTYGLNRPMLNPYFIAAGSTVARSWLGEPEQ